MSPRPSALLAFNIWRDEYVRVMTESLSREWCVTQMSPNSLTMPLHKCYPEMKIFPLRDMRPTVFRRTAK